MQLFYFDGFVLCAYFVTLCMKDSKGLPSLNSCDAVLVYILELDKAGGCSVCPRRDGVGYGILVQ